MPKTIRIQTDRISADLVAHHLHEEGVPAAVVSDGDWVGMIGTPIRFSLVVPADREERARAILADLVTRRRR